MIDQINELPEDGLKSSPETSRYTENKWISRKNQNKLYFLHLIDILNDLLLISDKVFCSLEAVVCRCSSKQNILKILQFSQESTCIGVSL